ncbi:MAG: ABC transporter permease [Candidatus Eremiobacteraeota bacterium]|nr:ABC transporter permease [Candidatus Eremiobacteraeota bacterium]
MSYLFSHLDRVAQLGAAHLWLVAVALVLATAIALPLSVLAARSTRIETSLLGVLGVVYTIPSLALLAVLVTWIGLGFTTVLIALVAYGQFVLVRNIAAGLRAVPPAAIDAARGLGLSPQQRLVRIEFPLALPAILGGLRIAAVSMIAIATLAAYVGAGGLGTLIFEGLAFHQPERTLAGSLCAMLLAIVIDAGFRVAEKRATRYRASTASS